MILTIKGADFSSANIGTLNTVSIRKNIGSGITHNIPSFIEKGASVTWTLTLLENYEFGTYSVTMGDITITPTVADRVMTISIANVTATISISVATTYVGADEPDEPVVPPVEPDVITLDSIAWDNMTYRQIFLENNLMPDINNNNMSQNYSKTVTYTKNHLERNITIENKTLYFDNKVSGYLKCDNNSNLKGTENVYGGVLCKADRYTSGFLGITIGTNTSSLTVSAKTSDYVLKTAKCNGNYDATQVAGIFLGGTTSANLSGSIKNPVLVKESIFKTKPSEQEWETMYTTFNTLVN